MGKQEHTPGPYKLDTECSAVIVTGKGGDVQVCACGAEDDPACMADAQRIKLALTCHDPLLAALTASWKHTDADERVFFCNCPSYKVLRRNSLTKVEHSTACQMARTAIASARGES